MGLLSMTDCTVADNRVQARYELNAATNDHHDPNLAAWAKKWGRDLLDYADAAPTDDDAAESDRPVSELRDAENEIATLKAAIRDAVSDLQDAI